MSKKEIINQINKNTENKELVKSLLLDTLQFRLEKSKNDKPYFSKIGGIPFFVDEANYPYCNNLPLVFLGQISLEQIKEYNSILPKNGIIYFFINIETTDLSKVFKVLYFENSNFHSIDIFPTGIKIIEEYYLSFYESYSFPSYQESIIKKSGITDEDQSIVEEIIFKQSSYITNHEYDVTHQILGHPQATQGTVRFWWAAKYLGLDKDTQYSEEDIKLIEKEEANFILLLQLNFGDPKIQLESFGDSVVYFGIHKKDLKNNNFNNVVSVIQNT